VNRVFKARSKGTAVEHGFVSPPPSSHLLNASQQRLSVLRRVLNMSATSVWPNQDHNSTLSRNSAPADPVIVISPNGCPIKAHDETKQISHYCTSRTTILSSSSRLTTMKYSMLNGLGVLRLFFNYHSAINNTLAQDLAQLRSSCNRANIETNA
jgi:hypothetical protein